MGKRTAGCSASAGAETKDVWRGHEDRWGVSGGSGWEGYEGIGGEIVRDMEGDGASRFWETVPKAGRFFCAIVGL